MITKVKSKLTMSSYNLQEISLAGSAAYPFITKVAEMQLNPAGFK